MFGSSTLDIAIALVFLYTLLSLVCSASTELFANLLNLRSRNLESVLRNLLDGEEESEEDGRVVNALLSHPIITSLHKPAGLLAAKFPSYISSRNFSHALLNTLLPAKDGSSPRNIEQLRKRVMALNNRKVRETLLPLIDAADGEIKVAVQNIEHWFDSSMVHAANWYKQRTQLIVFVTALVITLALNIDTLMILDNLWHNGILRDTISAQAQQWVANHNGADAGQAVQWLQANASALHWPIGWDCTEATLRCRPDGFLSGLNKVLGLLLTTLAVSLGAPFWFDLLNKLVNLRNKGQEPQNSAAGA